MLLEAVKTQQLFCGERSQRSARLTSGCGPGLVSVFLSLSRYHPHPVPGIRIFIFSR